MEVDGTAVTCDGNALSPTVDRRVRRTSRDVDEAERRTSSSGFSVCWSTRVHQLAEPEVQAVTGGRHTVVLKSSSKMRCF